MPKAYIFSPGQTFNRWTVLSQVPSRNGQTWGLFQCQCGTIQERAAKDICNNRCKSCGCLQREITVARNIQRTTHGDSVNCTTSPEYNIWRGIKLRTLNPNDQAFPRYGGRGITICDRWKDSFENFLADVGRRPGPEYSIDRYPDNDGNYEPGNVRWATREEQANNRRSSRFLTHKGLTLTVVQWARFLHINHTTLHERLASGWSIERALTR